MIFFFFSSAPKVLKGPLQVSNEQEVTAQHRRQVSCYMCSAGAATAGADATLLSSHEDARWNVRTELVVAQNVIDMATLIPSKKKKKHPFVTSHGARAPY